MKPLYRFENYQPIDPLPRDIDNAKPAPERTAYGRIAWRHPRRPNIVVRACGFARTLWTVCAGDRMLFNTYERERVERFIERLS